MRDMTEEEYAELDKRLTDTVPILGKNGTGFFSRKDYQVVDIDENTEKNPQYDNNWHVSNK
jgi:hypothetical protein